MKLVCPSCGAHHSAESWENDAAARRALALVGGLPGKSGQYALKYIALFRDPSAKRGMTWKRACNLLEELSNLIHAGWVQYNKGVSRPATETLWSKILAQVTENVPRRLPLKDHNYLLSIVYQEADEADRKQETLRNREERQGKGQHIREAKADENPLTKEEMQAMRKKNFGDILKDIK